MKIDISATGDDLAAHVDSRFGRCPFFLIIDVETMRYKVIPNEATAAMGGAGVRAAQIVLDQGIDAVISGDVGPNAFEALSAAGIKVYTGVSGVMQEVVEKYKKGEYKASSAPSVGDHFGLGGKRKGEIEEG